MEARAWLGQRWLGTRFAGPLTLALAALAIVTTEAKAKALEELHDFGGLLAPIACGKVVASRAIRPEQTSSWTIAGMPIPPMKAENETSSWRPRKYQGALAGLGGCRALTGSSSGALKK